MANYDTFTWKNFLPGSEGDFTLRVNTAQYGDGYAQRAADGLNNVTGTWPLQFDGSEAELKPILNFIKAKAGSTRFYWTPPGLDQALFVCLTYKWLSVGGGIYTLSCEFTLAY